jgi:hypothetical protein
MKSLVFALLLVTSPLAAETAPENDMDQGFSLLQEGAKLLLRGMASQVEPALKDMTDALEAAKPQLLELLSMMGNINDYHLPERLPNGDILLRHKTPQEMQDQAQQPSETEL